MGLYALEILRENSVAFSNFQELPVFFGLWPSAVFKTSSGQSFSILVILTLTHCYWSFLRVTGITLGPPRQSRIIASQSQLTWNLNSTFNLNLSLLCKSYSQRIWGLQHGNFMKQANRDDICIQCKEEKKLQSEQIPLG